MMTRDDVLWLTAASDRLKRRKHVLVNESNALADLLDEIAGHPGFDSTNEIEYAALALASVILEGYDESDE